MKILGILNRYKPKDSVLIKTRPTYHACEQFTSVVSGGFLLYLEMP